MVTKRKILRVPKNPRKSNIWESNHLNITAQQAAQIIYNIDELVEETGLYQHELPRTDIQVDLLYGICEAYIHMYQKLLKENLIITGNPEQHPNLH